MKLKDDTVRVSDISPQLVFALWMIEATITNYSDREHVGDPFVVTSINDGRHMAGSKHYSGNAADIRIWYMRNPSACCAAIRKVLGPDFDVVLEKDHIHLEYDPK